MHNIQHIQTNIATYVLYSSFLSPKANPPDNTEKARDKHSGIPSGSPDSPVYLYASVSLLDRTPATNTFD